MISSESNASPPRPTAPNLVTSHESDSAQSQYRDLFLNTVLGIYLCSPSGEKIHSANPAALALLGYDSEDELRESISDVATQIYVNPERCAELQRDLDENGVISAYEAQFIRKDGSRIWVSQNGRAIRNPQGGIEQYEIFIHDITHRKQTESELLKLLRAVEQSPVSVLICNPQGAIEYVNPKCEQASGYTAAELIGQNPRILQGGETSAETYQELWRTIISGHEWSGDLHNKKKNGELFWEHVAISPVRNKEGVITNFLAIKEDITEKKLLEERLLRAQRMENIGTLAGGIAHDLNNILAPIMMSIQMLKELYDQPAANGILDVIYSSAQRGADIVRQVLAFGRGLDGRRIELQPNTLVRELVGMITQTFPKSIQINSTCTPGLATILGDATQVHQVLLNLCVNARDAMPEGGTLRIRTSNLLIDEHCASIQPDAKPGPYVLIEVSDTGTGITPANREKIFDPFFTTKELGKGTGLGLSTSFGIIKSHGGFIDVCSAPGKGSCFKVFLPAANTGRLKEESAPDTTLPRGRGELILVVDDEAAVRQITNTILTNYGYRCLTANNGKEAIATYMTHHFDVAVVITDLMMPGMDGHDLINALRSINKTVKIIPSSGILLDEESPRQLRTDDASRFLGKPFTAKTLLNRLDEILGNRR